MTEKVSDHLHRHALIEKMLGRRMPQRMCSPLPGDDAETNETISDDFSQSAPIERPDRRAHREENCAPEARGPNFADVAEDGLTDST